MNKVYIVTVTIVKDRCDRMTEIQYKGEQVDVLASIYGAEWKKDIEAKAMALRKRLPESTVQAWIDREYRRLGLN